MSMLNSLKTWLLRRRLDRWRRHWLARATEWHFSNPPAALGAREIAQTYEDRLRDLDIGAQT